MQHSFNGEQTLLRIFIGERDKYEGNPLHEVLLKYFRKHDFAGATVLRAISGFGAHAKIHTDKILDLSLDLPIVVEVVAPEQQIKSALADLDMMIDGGMVTLEPVHVILYRPHDLTDEDRSSNRIEGLDLDDGRQR